MTLAGLMFTVMLGTVVVARRELSSLDVLAWRGLTSLPLAYLLARGAGLRLAHTRLFAVRAVLGFAAMFGFYQAARGLALTDLSLIHKLQPMLVAALAPLVLGRGERVDARVWLLIAVGLAGTAILLAPDLAVGSTYGLWAAGAAACSAGAHLSVRGLGRTDHPGAIVFWFHAAIGALAVASIGVTRGELLPLPPAHLWPYLVGCGVTALAGQLLMTHAYRIDRAAVVAGAAYSSPVWAVLGDLLVFAVLPAWNVYLGGALVIAAGIALIVSRDLPPAIREEA